MLGYIIMCASQPLIISILIWLTFPHKRRYSPLRAYIGYLAYFIVLEILRVNFINQNMSLMLQILINLELVTVYVIAKTECRGYIWTCYLQLLLLGMTISGIWRILIKALPLKDYMYKEMTFQGDVIQMHLISGVFGFLSTLVISLIIALIFRYIVRSDTYVLERICMPLGIITWILLNFTEVNNSDNAENWELFETVGLPIICMFISLIMILSYNIYESRRLLRNHKIIEEQIKKHKEDRLAPVSPAFENLYNYLQVLSERYESEGIIFEYRIEGAQVQYGFKQVRQFRFIIDDMFSQVNAEIDKKDAFILITVRFTKENVIIHVEYSKKVRHGLLRLFGRNNHIYIMDSFYRYEKKGYKTNELTAYLLN